MPGNLAAIFANPGGAAPPTPADTALSPAGQYEYYPLQSPGGGSRQAQDVVIHMADSHENPAAGIAWQHSGSIQLSRACLARAVSIDRAADMLTSNVTDFARVWEIKTGGCVSSSPCIGPDGTVYVGSGDHNLYALKDGRKVWEFPTGSPVKSSPRVGPDGTVYVGGSLSGPGWLSSGKSCMYALVALDGKSGQRKWEYPTGGFVNVAPALGDDGTVYAGGDDSTLYAVDGATGRKKWRHRWREEAPRLHVSGTAGYSCT